MLHELTTRSWGTPAATAISHPFRCHSSCPGACASVSIENMQPSLTAMPQELLGRVEALGTRVDLDCGSGRCACLYHCCVIERRLGPAASDDHPPGAVAEDVGVRALDGGEHALGHRAGVHPELGVDARHHDVESREQVLVLVEGAVFEYVDFDPGEDPERRELLVELFDLFELVAQPALRRDRARP